MSARSAEVSGRDSETLTGHDCARTCPSAPPEPDSVLFGLVISPGEVAYVSPGIPATPELLPALGRSEIPIENRARFAGRCMEHRCVQWSGDGGGRCGLADRALAALAIETPLETLPRCGIRSTCRWYFQHRGKACAACPEVIRRPARALDAATDLVGAPLVPLEISADGP